MALTIAVKANRVPFPRTNNQRLQRPMSPMRVEVVLPFNQCQRRFYHSRRVAATNHVHVVTVRRPHEANREGVDK